MSEFDSAGALFKSAPKSLAALMAAGAERARLWRPDELGAIFRHQLSAPILVDLGGFDSTGAARLKLLSEAQSLLLRSFSDLLLHAAPPIELLWLAKDFAKANMDHPDGSLPKEVAAVLYYASIAAALTNLDERISQLKDAELARGLGWAKDQPWVDKRIQELLVQGINKLPGTGPGGCATL
ncbi:MAG TPA: hypothetical protein VMR33_01985 [Candidatus Baltobacteraceae bacterium]|jgi:hypothetical protein|nr:hypothetical protein [Candidatus Baltobacteraceae bacterium]